MNIGCDCVVRNACNIVAVCFHVSKRIKVIRMFIALRKFKISFPPVYNCVMKIYKLTHC